MIEASAAQLAPISPDASQATRFFAALYGDMQGLVHFRGVPEPKDGRDPKNLHYALDDSFPATLASFLEWCNVESRAAFFLPGITRPNGTGKKDVLALPAITVDFDKGDPAANLGAVEALIGPATIVVESGGATEAGPKLHAYWRLETPATGEQIDEACRVREQLAKQFGGDPAFKQAAQVIRIPGSLHFKGTPKLVRLRSVCGSRVSLSDALQKLGISNQTPSSSNVVSIFDFNNVRTDESNLDRALTAPVHAEGVDDVTRFEAASMALGHFIRLVREGRLTLEAAWDAARAWNVATLVPPWPEERLRNDFDRLVRRDEENHGPILPIAPVLASQPSGVRLTDWYAHKRFAKKAPERRWLAEGLIPRGTAGLFAAVGDAGKSMLALKLANIVANYPPQPEGILGSIAATSFFGRPVVGRGTAVVLTAEDDADEVNRRLDNIAPDRAKTEGRLIVLPLLSTGGARAFICDGKSGPMLTPAWYDIRRQLEEIPDLALVVLDPLTLFVGGDTNDNKIAAPFMAEMNAFAAKTGAAVMLIHHFAKNTVPTGLTDARTAIRGAGAFVDNGRWALAIWEAESTDAKGVLKTLGQSERTRQAGVVYFGGLAKSNAPGSKELRTLVRGETGVLEDVTDQIRAAMPKRADMDDAIADALRKFKTKNVTFGFTGGQKGFLAALQDALAGTGISPPTRAEAAALFERLLTAGAIVATDAKRGGGNIVYEPR